MDLLSLLPEKFRDSQAIQDLLDVLASTSISLQGTSLPIHSKTKSLLRKTSTKVCLIDNKVLLKKKNVDLVIWNNEDGQFRYEIVTALYDTPFDENSSVYSLIRGRLFTEQQEFPLDSNVTLFVPLTVKEILDKIDSLTKNYNPYTCPQEYLQNLASLIGAVLRSSEQASANERRAELLMVTDWYKVKGTYQSIAALEAVSNLRFKLFDMYTQDYTTFKMVDWYVKTINGAANPPGLAQTYYKSPHFGLYIWLDIVYLAGAYDYKLYPDHIWRPSLFTDPVNQKTILDYVERTRPVNTVPHFGLYFECHTDESGEVFIDFDRNDNPIAATVVTENWSYGNVIFDKDDNNDNIIDITFDQDTIAPYGEIDYNFDTSAESFFNSITTFKVGNDRRFLAFYGTQIEMGQVIYTGSLSSNVNNSITVSETQVEICLVIPKDQVVVHETEYGMTRIGLYNSSNELVLLATFPSLYKDNSLDLFVKIIVYRTKDPTKYRKKRSLPPNLPDYVDIAAQCIGLCMDLQ